MLAWLQDEPTADRVEAILFASDARLALSSINAGEVYYKLARRRGSEEAEAFWRAASSGRLPLRLHGATDARVRRAAALKARFLVSYADAFAMGLAIELGQPLVTGDPEIRAAAEDAGVRLEWLG